ncbi:peptidylprolyl isomerase [Mycetocola tolaasinivorans]|uniref:Peptidylprolyl isomerase n=1 Tax=Mycetocola tolaasinivorans TaxID=76635 RepID=A0A3L7A7U1_9MICO|nr:peptidylprolyl isomerase [Mycetocola tolaasinivorans]
MSTDVLSVCLPGETRARLDALAVATGRPVTFHVREAVMEYLESLEYAHTLRAEAEVIRRGETRTRTLNAVKADLNLD